MKIKLIYNPVSGNGTFKNHLDYIIDKFQQKGFQIEPYRTENKDSLDKMLSQLQQDDYAKILVAGGDGTIHQVINCLLKYDINVPIGLFPVGTANDYAQCFNLPNNIEENVEIMLKDNYTYSDVGLMNDKYFINVASLGVLVDISQRTNTELKNSLGVLAYYLNGLTELPKLKAVKVKVTSDVMNYKGDILFMLIMNGRSAGGFKKIAPEASSNDGLLDVFIFKKCHNIELTSLLLAIINGDHVDSPHVIHFKTSNLAVNCNEEVGIDLDGEKGPDFPLKIKIIPQKLKIITRFNNEECKELRKKEEHFSVRNTFGQISRAVISGVHRKYKVVKSERNIVTDIGRLVRALPKHNAFNYVNRRALNDNFFEMAEKTLDNGYLYIVLSSTGSAAGETIRKVTQKEYSHVSLSFDEELKTIISYNGGDYLYSPGLNHEMIEFFNQKTDAKIIIYRLKATKEQKAKILSEIRLIDQQGSSYNVLGIIVPFSFRENIMFCSQFVYTMLKSADLNYFQKFPEKVKPTDFVELDYERRLEYFNKMLVQDILDKNKS